jgi:hypothetical protein
LKAGLRILDISVKLNHIDMDSLAGKGPSDTAGERPKLAFNFDGLLPVGDYEMTLPEIRSSILVTGPGGAKYEQWDSKWRAQLVDNLEIVVGQLTRGALRRSLSTDRSSKTKITPTTSTGISVAIHFASSAATFNAS